MKFPQSSGGEEKRKKGKFEREDNKTLYLHFL